jgi:RNA polymerase sigma factor (sigma-70 family)
MSEDSENGKDAQSGAQTGRQPPRLLAGQQALVGRLFAESGGSCWSLTRDRFQATLERSARKQFGAAPPSPQKLEEYLGALHLTDLVLAASCAEGHPEAWDHFVATYRGYLRAAAGAVLRCSASSPAACELADSLFADLYGLREGKRSDLSLFRYFHGRSSLKTWLRAVLAQRHVDAIRAGRRFTELDGEDPSGHRASQVPAGVSHLPFPADPHRERYVALFTRVLTVALSLLHPRDHQRLRLYYSEEQTLAEIGRALGEHESSVSRNLERIRHELRRNVEETLRQGHLPANGSSPEPGLSEEEIALCFEYSSEDAPIDLDKLFPPSAQQGQKPTRRQP